MLSTTENSSNVGIISDIPRADVIPVFFVCIALVIRCFICRSVQWHLNQQHIYRLLVHVDTLLGEKQVFMLRTSSQTTGRRVRYREEEGVCVFLDFRKEEKGESCYRRCIYDVIGTNKALAVIFLFFFLFFY